MASIPYKLTVLVPSLTFCFFPYCVQYYSESTCEHMLFLICYHICHIAGYITAKITTFNILNHIFPWINWNNLPFVWSYMHFPSFFQEVLYYWRSECLIFPRMVAVAQFKNKNESLYNHTTMWGDPETENWPDTHMGFRKTFWCSFLTQLWKECG